MRQHSNLDAPEETHFYRWCQPYKGPAYRQTYTRNPDLKNHREMDGISDEVFWEIFERSDSRRELQDGYMQRFLEVQNNGATRWFDKTPQNAYGINMLLHDYPGSIIIHIFRDPRNVVASMKKGVIIKQDDIVASISYWMESVSSLYVLQKAYPDNVIAVQYEKLLTEPEDQLKLICEFIDEPYEEELARNYTFKPPKDNYSKLLESSEEGTVMAHCRPLLDQMLALAI